MNKNNLSIKNKKILSYIVGAAIGDGNLSNPNSRATRLRISCDIKYPNIINNIISALNELLPNNKVATIKRKQKCIDISCYTNLWENWLGWKALCGSKYKQQISIPLWIKYNKIYTIRCLRGLFETDGSIYLDRGYKMVNFTTIIPNLAFDVFAIIKKLGFNPHLYKVKTKNKMKYVIRISKNTDKFIKLINLKK